MSTQNLPMAQISDQLARFAGTAFKVEEQDSGLITITTPFEHIYADPIVLYLSRQSDGSWLLTDMAKTRYWFNDFSGHDGYRKLDPGTLSDWETEAELFQTAISEGHEIMTTANSDELAPAVFRLLQTIMHIAGLGMARP